MAEKQDPPRCGGTETVSEQGPGRARPKSVDTRCRYRLLPTLHVRAADDRLLVLDPRSYSVHELNETATLIARMCDGATTCERMVANLVTDHGAGLREAATIVYRGLLLLLEQELVESL